MRERVRQLDHDDPRDRQLLVSLLGERLRSLRIDQDPDSRYRWLYLDNPHGRAVSFASFDGETEQPTGMLSLFPRRVLVDGELRLGAVLGDEHRCAMVCTRLQATALHVAAFTQVSLGVFELIFGASEAHGLGAMPGSVTASLGEIAPQVRYLRCGPALKRLLGRASRAVDSLLQPAHTQIEAAILDGEPDPRVGAVFRQVVSAPQNGRIIPVRDSEYVAWRYGRCPSPAPHAYLLRHRGKPVGFAAIEPNPQRARILDFWAVPEHASMALLAALRQCQPSRAVEFEQMEGAGSFRNPPWTLGFAHGSRCRPFRVRAAAHGPLAGLAGEGRQWSYTRSDVDLGGDSQRVSASVAAAL